MFRKLSVLFLALLSFAVHAEVWQARYGVGETFNFKLYNADGTLDVDESDGGTEVSVSCNEGAETTATNDFVDEGTFYSIALTSGEMNCERIAVIVAATTTEVFFIQTNSNASAMTPANDVNLVNIAGSAVSTSTAQLGVNVVNAGATAWGSGAITAASIATDAIGAAEIANAAIDAATFASGAIDATAIATDAIGAAEIATDAIGAAELAANAIAAAEIADGAIDAATYSTTAGAFSALGIVDQGTAQAATSTTLRLRSAAAFADDEIIGATCLITGGSAGVGQSRTVTDYVSSTDTATVATWTTTPTGTIAYECFGTATGASGSVTIAAGGITASSFASGAIDATAIAADAIGASEIAADAIGASEIAANAIGASEIASDAIAAAEIADGAIDAATFASGAITATVIATDAIGAAEIAADAIGASEVAADAIASSELAATAVTEIQTGLATSSALTTLDGKIDTVDTVADAIKAKTDQLTFGVTNQLDVNVESMNTVTVLGAGTTASPWNGQ